MAVAAACVSADLSHKGKGTMHTTISRWALFAASLLAMTGCQGAGGGMAKTWPWNSKKSAAAVASSAPKSQYDTPTKPSATTTPSTVGGQTQLAGGYTPNQDATAAWNKYNANTSNWGQPVGGTSVAGYDAQSTAGGSNTSGTSPYAQFSQGTGYAGGYDAAAATNHGYSPGAGQGWATADSRNAAAGSYAGAAPGGYSSGLTHPYAAGPTADLHAKGADSVGSFGASPQNFAAQAGKYANPYATGDSAAAGRYSDYNYWQGADKAAMPGSAFDHSSAGAGDLTGSISGDRYGGNTSTGGLTNGGSSWPAGTGPSGSTRSTTPYTPGSTRLLSPPPGGTSPSAVTPAGGAYGGYNNYGTPSGTMIR